MVSNISEETKPAIIPIIAPVGVKRFQYIVNNNTGKLLAAATMKVSDTRKVTLIFSSRRANKVEIIPIESAVQRAAHNCSFSVDIPFLIIWWYTSCENAVVDRKSTRLNSSHVAISYAVFC